MSRSNPQATEKPAKFYAEWKSDKQGFYYYNKELGGNIEIPLPFRFLVLDRLHTIKGYNDAEQSGFWANEVRNVKKDVFVVRSKKGICAEGIYDQVKNNKFCTGARYTQSVYVACRLNGTDLVIGNLQLTGAALSAWIEFCKLNKRIDEEGAVEVSGYTEGKKGKTTFYVPTFKKVTTTKETDEQAKVLDVELQKYLQEHLQLGGKSKDEVSVEMIDADRNSYTDTPPWDADVTPPPPGEDSAVYAQQEGEDDLPF